ncbi:acyl-CoA oxidase domain-containing protein [Ditylenchus destructor]|uniref:Acyl-coenzyme A oxidase n=1 Tax=Ditylenchus destructor TaxID=166010 RepID=A0AAD4NBX5_9BILA|nr:acyl-CoA oxidase domain-containing protein [Ditylenchus destructor]
MRNMNTNIDENHHNPDLTEERRKANFSTQSLAELIWNGKERLERRRKIAEYVESHKDLHKSQPIAFMSREQRLESVAKLSVAMMEHIDNRGAIDPTKPEDAWYFNTLVMGIDGDPFHLHYIMAIPTLMNNCDEEQLSEWLPKLLNREIIATYAQTELGHGNLGKSANFTVVVALLFTQDSGWHGAHPFWVQIRDLETHQPLPGITVGDIGPKFGISSNDNGFLRFNNVRIPRRHMLMKHAKVTPKGEYVRPVHAKVSYTSMMFVRSIMITGQALYLANACTIAIRYSCIRRQGEILPGKGEVKIIDYQTQQFRLFPQLARTFAFFFAGAYIRELYASTMQGVGTGDVSLLGDLHSLSSGLKSQVSFQVALGIEQCRMACGGHGYSDASGLPHLYSVAVGGCTYEGENMVMLLQVARYLMKRAREICFGDSNEHASSVTNYLFSKESKNRVISFSINNCQDSALHAFEHLSRRLTLTAYDRLEALKRGGQGRAALSHQEAWNELAVDLTKAARAHTRTFIARNFIERVDKIQDVGVKNVMTDLLSLYLNYELMDCSAGLLEDGYINSRDMDVVRNNVYDCLRRIRPQAVSIVDSFEFCDKELNSVLGRKDGRVYENLLKWAQDSPLNKTEVLPFHEKYLGRAMKNARQKSKL